MYVILKLMNLYFSCVLQTESKSKKKYVSVDPRD